ncbi:MAG: hypothetical protein ACK5LT_14000 [Lachnospirales bacterium]
MDVDVPIIIFDTEDEINAFIQRNEFKDKTIEIELLFLNDDVVQRASRKRYDVKLISHPVGIGGLNLYVDYVLEGVRTNCR